MTDSGCLESPHYYYTELCDRGGKSSFHVTCLTTVETADINSAIRIRLCLFVLTSSSDSMAMLHDLLRGKDCDYRPRSG